MNGLTVYYELSQKLKLSLEHLFATLNLVLLSPLIFVVEELDSKFNPLTMLW
ncbi:hypothetical protein LBWT_X0140 (plasmid) [Leptolyngbya boryana IAM M-101]|nr:hypothetical protein LBWT_X0140 [Leptolyngbya boryana IAM M-101]BAS66290.1 hypothetical protein LBDG_X0140 [Leptolyngbya boryana dg5]